MFNNIFKIYISLIALLVLCVSIYIAVLVSLNFFDQDTKPLSNKNIQDNRTDYMGPRDMMRGPIDPHMNRGPIDPHMNRAPLDHHMNIVPMSPRDMTVEEYELIIKELELQKQHRDRETTLDKNRIDLEIQRLTNKEYELIIKELELEKQQRDKDVTLEKDRIDLEIQRLTNEKDKLK
jgi:hypothetical protein